MINYGLWTPLSAADTALPAVQAGRLVSASGHG